MPAPQSLIQAALNRTAARVGSGLLDTAANLAVLAQDAPERLRQEFSLFWEEVEQEADRLERADPTRPGASDGDGPGTPQEQIDALRAQVAGFARRLDRSNGGQG